MIKLFRKLKQRYSLGNLEDFIEASNYKLNEYKGWYWKDGDGTIELEEIKVEYKKYRKDERKQQIKKLLFRRKK